MVVEAKVEKLTRTAAMEFNEARARADVHHRT
jgi:hypothetical protein